MRLLSLWSPCHPRNETHQLRRADRGILAPLPVAIIDDITVLSWRPQRLASDTIATDQTGLGTSGDVIGTGERLGQRRLIDAIAAFVNPSVSPKRRLLINSSHWPNLSLAASMRTSKCTQSQIVSVLKQADAKMAVTEICRQVGIRVATFDQWQCTDGGMDAFARKRVKDLEADNGKFKQMYAKMA